MTEHEPRITIEPPHEAERRERAPEAAPALGD